MTASLPPTLQVALKEWAAVCSALSTGRQIVLLRKGGIWESAGEFQVEHPQFLLFPTHVHQSLNQLKPEAHAGFQPYNVEPARITMSLAGQVTDILKIEPRQQMDRLDDQHIWAPPLLDMRFNYRPENPLYLLLVRAYKLAEPLTVENTPAYAGCKSWVPLAQPFSTQNATAILDDDAYQSRRDLIRSRL